MKNEFDYLNEVKMDFSVYGEEIMTEKELNRYMKGIKKTRIRSKKVYALAACIAAAAITTTAFASGYVVKIVKEVSTGHNSFVQTKTDGLPQSMPVPDSLMGLIYDKDGNMLTEMARDTERIYDADGNEIKICAKKDENGTEYYTEMLEAKTAVPENDDTSAVFTDLDEYKKLLNFELKLPQELPEGYSFLYGKAFRKETGSQELSGDYADVVYSNGEKVFYVHERIINDETHFTAGTEGEIRELEINSCKAVMMDGSEISWEQDGISVNIMGTDAVNGDALINMAKSVK